MMLPTYSNVTHKPKPLTASDVLKLSNYVKEALAPIMKHHKSATAKNTTQGADFEKLIEPLRVYYVNEWMQLHNNQSKEKQHGGQIK
jgi:hypothetical protein